MFDTEFRELFDARVVPVFDVVKFFGVVISSSEIIVGSEFPDTVVLCETLVIDGIEFLDAGVVRELVKNFVGCELT